MEHPLLKYLGQNRSNLSPLLILTHDHPDPDAIASAWTLSYLAHRLFRIRSFIAYGGIIGRMENKLMVELLRIPLKPLQEQDLSRYSRVALVDCQPPFQNNRFPSRREASIVIDHHPRHAKTRARRAFIDESAGATVTFLAEALEASGLSVPSGLATAILYGIGSETQNLAREAGPRDIAAYRSMFAHANVNVLSKIQNPPRPGSFFRILARAINRAFAVGRIIGVHLGPVPSQDIVSHMADFLLTHEEMAWSLVTGRYEGKLFVSLRTKNPRAEAGRLLWRLLGGGSSAGGHAMIAGGSVPVGEKAAEAAWRKAEEKVAADFLQSHGFRRPFAFRYPYAHTGEHHA